MADDDDAGFGLQRAGPHSDVDGGADGPPGRWFAPATLAAFALLLAALALPLALGGPEAPRMAAWIVAVSAALAGALALAGAIDVETGRLPDALTLPLAGAGIAVAAAIDVTLVPWRIGAAVAGYGLLWGVARAYLAHRGRAGLGLGDAKLLAAGGAWLGLGGLPSVLLIAALGALLAVGVARWRGTEVRMDQALPFGPFLALGIWMVWLYGPLA